MSNRLVDHFGKCGLFSVFQYGFRSCRSTENLLTVVGNRFGRVFNMSSAIPAIL